ncbi:hypothetical protein LJR090_000212 [Bosea sp. LjRoot90]|uniref:hypothetical protein n=1 Tax=Bosea sp. LjRoot90 TaxID=3342342 RepID=UPI003ECC7FC0
MADPNQRLYSADLWTSAKVGSRLPISLDSSARQIVFVLCEGHQASYDIGKPGSLALVKLIGQGRSDFAPGGFERGNGASKFKGTRQ